MVMSSLRCPSCIVAAVLSVAALSGGAADAQRNDDKKPSLSLRASPASGFAPLRVRMTVEVRGGADDTQELYCASVEWDWGDDQKSQNSQDCDPYEAGKSQIQRRYTMEHSFNYAGTFTTRFRLKQGTRVVASASTNVNVRDGFRDGADN
jgi:hypothetical protein